MTLVNRWYNILDKMVSQPTYSLVDMRSELDISLQTLQKSIQQLNDVLAPNIQIISQDDLLMLEVYESFNLELHNRLEDYYLETKDQMKELADVNYVQGSIFDFMEDS